MLKRGLRVREEYLEINSRGEDIERFSTEKGWWGEKKLLTLRIINSVLITNLSV